MLPESHFLELDKKIAKRDGNVLTLRLNSGKQLKLTDFHSPDCGPDDCIGYQYAGSMNGFFIVEEGYWEGGSVALISRRSGKRYEIMGYPHLSPDGRFIATVEAAEAYGNGGIHLWQIRGNRVVHKGKFSEEEFEILHWEGNEKVIAVNLWSDLGRRKCDGEGSPVAPFVLSRSKQDWSLQRDYNASKVKCLRYRSFEK